MVHRSTGRSVVDTIATVYVSIGAARWRLSGRHQDRSFTPAPLHPH